MKLLERKISVFGIAGAAFIVGLLCGSEIETLLRRKEAQRIIGWKWSDCESTPFAEPPVQKIS